MDKCARFLDRIRAPAGRTLADRNLLKHSIVNWREALRQSSHFNMLNKKAMDFLHLNNQIKAKIVLYKMRKVTRKHKETIEALQIELQKKYRLRPALQEWFHYATKTVKIKAVLDEHTLARCFKGILMEQ